MTRRLIPLALAMVTAGAIATGCGATKETPTTGRVPVTGVTLKAATSLLVGGAEQLTAVVTPAGADQRVTWKSSAPSIVKVDGTGLVTALATGTATVTATAVAGGSAASCVVTVTTPVVAVTAVTLDQATLPLIAGSPGTSATLTATVAPAGATNQNVTWSTSDASVATVSATAGGAVTVVAHAPGKASITVRTVDGMKVAVCAVTVAPVSVTGVTLDRAALPLVPGGTSTLTATVAPSNATTPGVTWKSSDPAVATVSATGLVTAVASGTATVTVTTVDGGKTASCAVTVTTATVAVTGVSLAPTTLSLFAGSPGTSGTLTATVAPATATNQNVSWSTSNPSVATLSATTGGAVTVVAHAPGSASITVTTGDGAKTAVCAVTVAPVLVTGVAVDREALPLTEGDAAPLAALVSPLNATDTAVSWAIDDAAVASLGSTTGSPVTVTAKAPGVAHVTVTTRDGGKTAVSTVTVNARVFPVTGVTLDPPALTMTEGETRTLAATVLPSNATDAAVTWASDDESVATVTPPAGTPVSVIAKKAGVAHLTVTTHDGGKTAVATVTVQGIPVNRIDLDRPTLLLGKLGSATTGTLIATVGPATASNKNVQWSSSDPSIAAVSGTPDGVATVTAVGAGIATITATTVDGGLIATCTVNVALVHQAITADTATQFPGSSSGYATLYDNQYVESTVGALAYFAQNNGFLPAGGIKLNYYGAGSAAANPGTVSQLMKSYVGIPAANVPTSSPSVKVIVTSSSGSKLALVQHGRVSGGQGTGAVLAVQDSTGTPPQVVFDGMPANVQLDVFNGGANGTSAYVDVIRVEPSSTAVVDVFPPAEVSLLTATPDAASATVTLAWTNPSDADLDRVECSEGTHTVTVLAAAPSTCVFNGLALGAHTFTVRTVDTHGNVSAGAPVQATLSAAGPLLDVTIPATTASTYLTPGTGGAYHTNSTEVTVGQLVFFAVNNGFKNGDGNGGIMTNHYGSSATTGAVSMSAYVGIPAAVTAAKSTVTVTVYAKGYSGAIGKLGLAQQTSAGKGTVVEVKDPLTAAPVEYVFHNVPAGRQLDLFNAAANGTYVYIESIKVE